MHRADWFEKTLMLGKIEGRRRRGWQRMRWLDGITNLIDMSLHKLRELRRQGGLACCHSWGHKESDATERLIWTELNWFYVFQLLQITLKLIPSLSASRIMVFQVKLLSSQSWPLSKALFIQRYKFTYSVPSCQILNLDYANHNSCLKLHNFQEDSIYFLLIINK